MDIKELRKALGLSQKDFAEKIGVSGKSVSAYELGKTKPSKKVLERIKELDVGDLAVGAVKVMEKAEEASVVAEIEVKKNVRKAGRKVKEAAAPIVGDIKEATAPVVEDIKEAVAPVTEKISEAAAPITEKIGDVVEPVVKKVEEVTAKQPAITIESGMGGQISLDDILSRIPDGVDQVYIKPEENKAYWVSKDWTGSIDLW